MKIRYVTGDLIAGKETLIAHGCNSRGVYRSGVAGAIRSELPFAYDSYALAFDDPATTFQLGDIVWAINIAGWHTRPRIVANMITQQDYGRDDRQYVSYEAITIGLRNIDTFVAKSQDGTFKAHAIGPITEVGFPLLGCGLGNGKWRIVSEIIEHESRCFQPVVYTLDGRIPD
jgi:O-acetyl-ADP-ribose deacetylase (regulator of RNase III)